MPRATRIFLALLVLSLIGGGLWFLGDAGDVSAPRGKDAAEAPPATRPGEPREEEPSPPPDARVGGVEREATDGGAAPSSGTETIAGSVRGTGRVVDENGAAIPGARVRALLHRQAFVTVHEPLGVEAVTGGTGEYQLDGLPDAAAIAITAERDGRARGTVGPIQTPRDGAFRLPTITLGPGLVLTGTVRAEPDLTPIAGARVTVSPDRSDDGRVAVAGLESAGAVGLLGGRTDAAGRFAIPGLDFTHYRIEATAEGYAPAVLRRSFIASRGREEVEVTLTLPATDAAVKGVVLAGGSSPVAGALVRAVRRPGGVDAHAAATRSAADGTFELTGLTRGTYDVEAQAPGFSTRAPVAATPGEADLLRIELAPHGSIRGRVTAPGRGAPKEFTARVLRVEGSTGRTRPVKHAQAGEAPLTFVADDLSPGRYVIEVEADGAARSRSAPIEVSEGLDVRDVVVELESGGSLRGVVVDAAGAPVGAAGVVLLAADYDPKSSVSEVTPLLAPADKSARTGKDGGFVLAHVEPGTYALKVLADDGGGAFVRDVTVVEGEPTDVGEVEVAAPGRIVGVARGVDGEPLPRARVVAVGTATGTRQGRWTEADGSFALGPLPAGTYSVFVEAADLWKSFEFTSDTPADVPPNGEVEITVRVRRR